MIIIITININIIKIIEYFIKKIRKMNEFLLLEKIDTMLIVKSFSVEFEEIKKNIKIKRVEVLFLNFNSNIYSILCVCCNLIYICLLILTG